MERLIKTGFLFLLLTAVGCSPDYVERQVIVPQKYLNSIKDLKAFHSGAGLDKAEYVQFGGEEEVIFSILQSLGMNTDFFSETDELPQPVKKWVFSSTLSKDDFLKAGFSDLFESEIRFNVGGFKDENYRYTVRAFYCPEYKSVFIAKFIVDKVSH